jgi:hypothetical protein
VIFETVQEWAKCRDALLPAIEMTDGTHTEDDVLEAILTGRMKLWRRERSALVTEFCQFPRLKALNIFLAGGDLEDIMTLENDLTSYAIRNGCQRITILAARDGWQRMFPGSKKAGMYMTRDV